MLASVPVLDYGGNGNPGPSRSVRCMNSPACQLRICNNKMPAQEKRSPSKKMKVPPMCGVERGAGVDKL